MDESKPCRRCHIEKPLTDFYQRSKSRTIPGNSRESWCKACTQEVAIQWRIDNPEKFRRTARTRMLRKNYGITHEEYDRMLDEQDGRCGGCGKTTDENDGRLFAVDHDHATGSVRGLLCSPCNLALGNARDSATTLRSLIAYLERHLQSASAELRIGAQNHDH